MSKKIQLEIFNENEEYTQIMQYTWFWNYRRGKDEIADKWVDLLKIRLESTLY